MSRIITIHDEARYDVIEIAYYIAEDSLEASDRFVEAVDSAYVRLAEMPGIGVIRDFGNQTLKGMRMWPVPGFPKHLIFYRTTDSELRVIRVLHGARDMESVFRSNDEQ